MLYPLLLAAGLASLCVYIREKIRAYSVKALLLKSVVSLLFICVAVCGFWHAAASGKLSPLCPFVLTGLIFGLLGDIWLDLKYIFPEKDEPFTYAGFYCFGIGHVLFIAGMLLSCCPAGRSLFALLPLLGGLVLSGGNAVLEKPMKLNYGKLRPTVILYGFLLFSMVLTAGSLALAGGRQVKTLTLLFAGGVLFAVSDLILSGTYFGEGRERPIDLALNYICYYAGQFLIASSLMFLA